MPRWRSIWLVARREILERGRSRGFLLSVAFTTLIVVGSFVLPAILLGSGNGDARSASSSRHRRASSRRSSSPPSGSIRKSS